MDFLLGIFRWLHFLAGITWIGLLYYFNFVQVPALAKANADKEGPGPAAITKYVAPLALDWFRWSALATWLAGVIYLLLVGQLDDAVILGIGQDNPYATNIGVGGWLGTIMFLNVWLVIWPNQKKVLGMVEASDEEKARARRVAALASRTNTLLSIPMLLFMGAASHGLIY